MARGLFPSKRMGEVLARAIGGVVSPISKRPKIVGRAIKTAAIGGTAYGIYRYGKRRGRKEGQSGIVTPGGLMV